MSTGYESTYPATGYGSETQIRNEFSKIQTALEDTVSRSNTGDGPNEMEADLDMGGNTIFNTQDIMLGGESIYDIINNISQGFADAAAQSAIDAADSAAAALVSENNAATSESNAADSEQAASNSANGAQGSLEDFRGRYYGAYATAPTEDPYGNPSTYGDWYFDTTTNYLMVWGTISGVDAWRYAGTGPKGDKGDTGLTGPVGPEGEEGPRGQRGERGFVGPQGPQGIQGIQGIQGNRGPQGIQGPVGAQGDQGIQGVDGPQGIQGFTGDRGAQGFRGDSFSVDAVGDLVDRDAYDTKPAGFVFFAQDQTVIADDIPVFQEFAYSSTDSYSLNSQLSGQQTLMVMVNNILQSPAAYSFSSTPDGYFTLSIEATPGDTITVREIGSPSVFGVVFFKLSNTPGDWSDPVPFGRGPQGPIGETGQTGPQGIKGDTGPQGIQGIPGLIGPQGIQGEVGDQGEIGPQGPIGETGAPGIDGDEGPRGARGFSAYDVWKNEGNLGDVNDYIASLKGDKGDTGAGFIEAPNDGRIYSRSSADWLNIDVDNDAGLTNQNPYAKASAETSITAGAGLVGGGKLNTNRGLSIGPSVVNSTASHLGGGANLNLYTSPGVYYQDSNANTSLVLNYPVALAGSLEVFTAAGVVQVYRPYNSGRVFQRGWYSEAWSTWVELASKDDLETLATKSEVPTAGTGLSKSGTQMSVKYGTSAGTALQGNSIVQSPGIGTGTVLSQKGVNDNYVRRGTAFSIGTTALLMLNSTSTITTITPGTQISTSASNRSLNFPSMVGGSWLRGTNIPAGQVWMYHGPLVAFPKQTYVLANFIRIS